MDGLKDHKLVPIDGLPPSLINRPETCAFLPRCPYSIEECRQKPWPDLKLLSDRHFVACYVDLVKGKAKSKKIYPATADLKESPDNFTGHSFNDIILKIDNLKMYFSVTKGIFQRKTNVIKAVENVSFQVKKGETLGLVGESGCGKTTIARCILQLYRPTDGEVLFEGENILEKPKKRCAISAVGYN